jgi:hypothetical protein
MPFHAFGEWALPSVPCVHPLGVESGWAVLLFELGLVKPWFVGVSPGGVKGATEPPGPPPPLPPASAETPTPSTNAPATSKARQDLRITSSFIGNCRVSVPWEHSQCISESTACNCRTVNTCR